MNSYISDILRNEVANRAGHKCEYCLLKEITALFRFHVDHIKSSKHGGSSETGNLAYSCPDCNYYKGTDLGTFVNDDENLTRFYNPRTDRWTDHFYIDTGEILSKTVIGQATVQIFRFNDINRLIFRQQLIELEQYP